VNRFPRFLRSKNLKVKNGRDAVLRPKGGAMDGAVPTAPRRRRGDEILRSKISRPKIATEGDFWPAQGIGGAGLPDRAAPFP
jgi:hypothetical protein